MRRIQGLLAALVLAASTMSSARADRLELETGDVFIGRILRVNDQEVSIQLASGGILSFRMSGVRSVRKIDEAGEESAVVFERAIEDDDAAEAEGDEPILELSVPAAGRRADGVTVVSAPPVAAEESLLERAVEDPRGRFSVAVPRGFVPWPEARSSIVVLAFKDPFTQATLTVSSYSSGGSVEAIQRSALRSAAQGTETFRVLRDEKVPAAGERAEAWIVEVESRIGAAGTRALHVFTRGPSGTVVLLYSARTEDRARFDAAFEKSIDSFRFSEPSEPVEERPAED